MTGLALLVVVTSGLAACGRDDGANAASAPAGDGGDAPGSGGEDDASGASGGAGAGGRPSGGGSSNAGAAGNPSGAGAGLVVLHRRPGMGGAIADWDTESPRPLIIFSKGTLDDAWRPTDARIERDGTVTSFAEGLVVWGFSHPLDVIYDGVFTAGVLDDWSMDDPPPLIAMGTGGTLGDTWAALATGESIDDMGRFAGSSATRVVVFGWRTAPSAPVSLHFGENDGSVTIEGWSVAEPLPLLFWQRTDAESAWHFASVAVLADRTLDPAARGRMRVYGWSAVEP